MILKCNGILSNNWIGNKLWGSLWLKIKIVKRLNYYWNTNDKYIDNFYIITDFITNKILLFIFNLINIFSYNIYFIRVNKTCNL